MLVRQNETEENVGTPIWTEDFNSEIIDVVY